MGTRGAWSAESWCSVDVNQASKSGQQLHPSHHTGTTEEPIEGSGLRSPPSGGGRSWSRAQHRLPGPRHISGRRGPRPSPASRSAAPPAARVSAGAMSSWGPLEAETLHPLLSPWRPRCRQEGRVDPWSHQTAAPWRARPHPRMTGTLMSHHSREAQSDVPLLTASLAGRLSARGQAEAAEGGQGRPPVWGLG